MSMHKNPGERDGGYRKNYGKKWLNNIYLLIKWKSLIFKYKNLQNFRVYS
jgi:hypothetical protein